MGQRVEHNANHRFIKSLDSYTAEDQDIFFGREAEMTELHRLVESAQVLLVYGPSGAGKTSLIQCGLSKKLGPDGWRPVFVRRDQHLLQDWAQAIGAEAGAEDGMASIEERMATLVNETGRPPITFVFDQFEELFISGSEEETMSFFRAVKGIRLLGEKVRFIFVCREEFLANFSVAEVDIPDLMAHRMRVVLMTVRQMSEVLASMLRISGRPFDPGFLTAFESVLRTEGEGADLAGFQVYVEYLLSEIPPDVPLTPAHIGGRNSYRRAMERYITRQLSHLADPDSALELLKFMVSGKGTKLRGHRADG